jgi:hypothetical protein
MPASMSSSPTMQSRRAVVSSHPPKTCTGRRLRRRTFEPRTTETLKIVVMTVETSTSDVNEFTRPPRSSTGQPKGEGQSFQRPKQCVSKVVVAYTVKDAQQPARSAAGIADLVGVAQASCREGSTDVLVHGTIVSPSMTCPTPTSAADVEGPRGKDHRATDLLRYSLGCFFGSPGLHCSETPATVVHTGGMTAGTSHEPRRTEVRKRSVPSKIMRERSLSFRGDCR